MTSDMENNKWLDESPALKQVNPNNPFAVPSGYFDELEQGIMSGIYLAQLKLNSDGFIVPENYFAELNDQIQSRITIEEQSKGNNQGFALPTDYFEQLSADIQSRITIEEFTQTEAKGLTVPENYFDELSGHIQSRINVEEFVNKEDDGLAVPENYFDNLQQQITARISVEEALNETEADFRVPAGYFEALNKAILNKTVNQDIVKRKGIVRKMFASGAFKYAAAACFALIVGTGIFIIEVNDPVVEHNNSFLHKQLSTVPVSDIQAYLQRDLDGSDTQHTVVAEGAKVNDADLNNALQDYTDPNNQ